MKWCKMTWWQDTEWWLLYFPRKCNIPPTICERLSPLAKGTSRYPWLAIDRTPSFWPSNWHKQGVGSKPGQAGSFLGFYSIEVGENLSCLSGLRVGRMLIQSDLWPCSPSHGKSQLLEKNDSATQTNEEIVGERAKGTCLTATNI